MNDTPLASSDGDNPCVLTVPVVAIGASAGGLEACSELLRHLTVPTGRAFVVIQHLDPTHASQLTALLARVSPLPVREVVDGIQPEADHVYVITPDTGLELRAGRLRCEARPPGRFMPVDHFLQSLAEAQGERAVAVILSGTGVDGSLGAQIIRRHGGVVYAQDDSAQQSGMPASVVADFVLSPAEIARSMLPWDAHDDRAEQAPAAVDEEALRQLFSRLKRITSVAYSEYKRSTILRRVHRRIALLRQTDLPAYLAFIDEHPAELEQLHGELLIHVTSFFRDPDTFDTLCATVLPRLLSEGTAERPVRVWVPGCATGEEVYSLAICLLEALGDAPRPPPVKIFATDISDEALDKARAGRYPEAIATEVSTARLREYFVSVPGGYQITKRVRDLCVFARHDVTSDPPFSNLDLISCRNVLIYLSPDLQRRILPIFHYALRDNGVLLLGGAESVGHLTELFAALDKRQRIYLRKAHARRLPVSFFNGDPAFRGALMPLSGASVKLGGTDLQRDGERATLAHYAPPGVIVSADMEILQSRGDTAPFLTLAPGMASLNLMKMAREGLLIDLRAAIEECRRSGHPARREGVRVKGVTRAVSVQVLPFVSANERCFSVSFETTAASDGAQAAPLLLTAESTGAQPPAAAPDEIEALREELADTRAHLQSIIEQQESSNEELRAANEEILSSNEELQSTNEELQTAKEELQATNEELSTVNDEIQHRIREAVQLSDDLTNLFRNVNLPIVMVGQDLRVRRFTPAAGELFNLIPGDVGRPLTDIKTRLVGDDLQQRILRVIATLTGVDDEVSDESGRMYSMSIRPYRTQDNRLDGAVISVMDIDAIKRGESAMRLARDYAESIIDTVDLPLLVLDQHLHVVSANRAFHSSFNTTAATFAGADLDDVHGLPWYSPAVPPWLHAALAANLELPSLEIQVASAQGTARSFIIDARPLPSGITEGPRLLLRIEDVTAQRRDENQQRQAQKMEAVGQLASGIAHDFNNLLTVISGYANLLSARLAGDAKSREMLEAIIQAGERAAALTGQLLAFSRKSMLNSTLVDLRALLGEFEVMLRRVIGETIEVTVQVAADVGSIVTDPSLLTQVLLNLAINARDAMPDGGALRVEVTNVTLDREAEKAHAEMTAGEYVCLTVSDTGTGIDEATLPHIFEPFFTTKDVGKGTGMGLASVYGAVHQSGGHVYVDSRPGSGTRFSVYLPRVGGVPRAPAPEPTLEELPRGHEVLLLVEDETEVRSLAKTVLEGAGYTVLEAVDGEAALECLRAHGGPIDLLVTDIVMPRLGGYELARRLRLTRPDLGVLFVSGYNEEARYASGLDTPLTYFLVKPYSPAALVQRVRSLLNQRPPIDAGDAPRP